MKIRPKTFEDGFKVEVSEYRNLDFGQKVDIQAQHGAFVRYDATRLKGNVAIVDDDGGLFMISFFFSCNMQKLHI